MSLLSTLSKLSDIIVKPIELMTDFAREPLRNRDHNRGIERDHARLNAESHNKIKEMEATSAIKAKEKELDTTLSIKRGDAESHNKIKEMEATSAIKAKEKELDTILSIKRETEVKRIFIELEELKKDKELQRMIAVSEAIMKYQQELTKLNINAINAIGNMQLDLREKAQQLVYDKTIKYKTLQDQAFNEAENDLKRIDNDFSDNKIAKEILTRAVEKRLANIIDTAHNFLLELNADIKLINQSISMLTEHGQTFIESHLEKFHVIESASETVKQIENKSS